MKCSILALWSLVTVLRSSPRMICGVAVVDAWFRH
jgi:hypothetical protein